ncbi:alpha/beta hydrolase [bacterium]|nr:alpha/beta hydrolase [bacterium]
MDIITRNFVNLEGPEDGPVVLLAHGLGCDQRFWRPLAARLSSRYRLVLFDYVGSGNSRREAYSNSRYGHLDGYRDDLLEVRQALGLTRVHLVGHSISSMIGMLAILKEPEPFLSLTMVAPSPRFLNEPETGYVGGFEKSEIDDYLDVMDRNFIGWATAFAQLAAGPDAQAERDLYESFCSTDPRTIRTFAELALYVDLRHRLPELMAETLILQCHRDPLAPLTVGKYLCEQIPKAHYAELDLSGHCPQVTHPDLVAARLEQFWQT